MSTVQHACCNIFGRGNKANRHKKKDGNGWGDYEGMARPYKVPAKPDTVPMNAQSIVTKPILKYILLVASPSMRIATSGSFIALICSGERS